MTVFDAIAAGLRALGGGRSAFECRLCRVGFDEPREHCPACGGPVAPVAAEPGVVEP